LSHGDEQWKAGEEQQASSGLLFFLCLGMLRGLDFRLPSFHMYGASTMRKQSVRKVGEGKHNQDCHSYNFRASCNRYPGSTQFPTPRSTLKQKNSKTTKQLSPLGKERGGQRYFQHHNLRCRKPKNDQTKNNNDVTRKSQSKIIF